jgi:DNA polymerase I-like protein with 3'-5' exonuclease and polymerase domains
MLIMITSIHSNPLHRQSHSGVHLTNTRSGLYTGYMSTTPLRPCVPAEMNPPLKTHHITDAHGLEYGVKDFLSRVHLFGADIETNLVEDFVQRKVRSIQVGDRNEQYFIDLWELAGRDTEFLSSIQGNHGRKVPKDGVFKLLRDTLVPALDSRDYEKVGHNLYFDYMGLSWCLGIFMWNLWCTQLAEKVRYAGAVSFWATNFWGLEHLTGRYLGIDIPTDLGTTFWPAEGPQPLTERQLTYGGLDVRLPVSIRTGQIAYLDKHNLMATAEIENDAIPAFGDLRINGFFMHRGQWLEQIDKTKIQHARNLAALDEAFIPLVGRKGSAPTDEELLVLENKWQSFGVDSPEELEIKEQLKDPNLRSQKEQLRAKRTKLEEKRKENRAKARQEFSEASKLRTWFKREGEKMEGEAMINYGAPAQIKNALQKIKGITKTNLKDTNDKTLNKLKAKFPIIQCVMNYRGTGQVLKSFGASYPDDYIHPETGRIHATFNQLQAETGRISCEGPNLTQIPNDTKSKEMPQWDAKFRACFQARPGWKLCTRDLAGCELRIMAEASGEEIWIFAFKRDEDIHEIVAFKVSETLTPGEWQAEALPDCQFAINKKKCECPAHEKKRKKVKITNFGIGYGLTVYGLMEQLGCDESTAQQIIDSWHRANPTLSRWLTKKGEQAKMTGEARTLIGRRRIFLKPTFEQAKAKLIEEWRKKKWEGIPTNAKVMNQLIKMLEAIKRQGMNHPIQGSNADLTKMAVGCGFDSTDVPFLWHFTRPDRQYSWLNYAKSIQTEDGFSTERPDIEKYVFGLLENFVHDEIVVESPAECATRMDELMDSALQRAGATFVHSIPMTTDGNIDDYWSK